LHLKHYHSIKLDRVGEVIQNLNDDSRYRRQDSTPIPPHVQAIPQLDLASYLLDRFPGRKTCPTALPVSVNVDDRDRGLDLDHRCGYGCGCGQLKTKPNVCLVKYMKHLPCVPRHGAGIAQAV
jgi:hypothetical protein